MIKIIGYDAMFQVTPIPAFNDNYIWMLSHENAPKQVVVVDPGDAQAVIDVLKNQELTLEAILITHHHQDHTGGVAALANQYSIPIYGPANSPFTGITHPLEDGDTIQVLNTALSIKAVPGHTLDHIAYFSEQDTPQLLCGDTLFLAGCGRLFEGTAQQMLSAMNYFKSLPDSTQVYCTHEYSLANLAFANAVEPNNEAIQSCIESCEALRAENKPTLPSSIAQEKSINPFMRTHLSSVQTSINQHTAQSFSSEEAIFAALREWKNHF